MQRKIQFGLFLIAWGALLIHLGCPSPEDWVGGTPVPPAPAPAPGDTALEMEAFNLVNAERAAHGLPPLSMTRALRSVARAHSQDMADNDFFSHTNLDGQSPFDRMRAAGIEYRTAGENIGWNNYPNPAEIAVQGWMDSPGHRANILRESFTHTGMGVAVSDDGKYYFTQVFAGF